MKILITGAAGFIGGEFFRKSSYAQSEKKRANKHSLIDTFVSVDKVKGNAMNSMYWNANHPFYAADIIDSHIIDVIFQREQPDIVIHGAAETSVDLSLKDPNLFISTNILGTQVIVNACVKHKVKKLIFASSDQVYGQLLSEQEPSWTEQSPLNPRNPYAVSKVAGEMLIKVAAQTYGLNYNILRSSDCYGYRQLPEKLIPKIIQCIKREQEIPLYGHGLQIRDWLYVMDHNFALNLILEKGVPNEIYNIGAGQEYSNLEIANYICKAMGRGHSLIKFIDDPRGQSHDFRYAMNCSKLKELGWKPAFKFKEALELTVANYESNPWFLQ
jgi:dTDP-glucose 4,6-dehydratase